MKIQHWLGAAMIVALGMFAAPEQAAAAPAIINTGQVAFPAGDGTLPPKLAEQALPGWQAGYQCSVIGVFWAYLHKWDCEAVAFHDDSINAYTYDNSPEVSAAVEEMYDESDINMGLWGAHGRWLILLLVIGGVVAKFRPGG